jgi:hypothetical protein
MEISLALFVDFAVRRIAQIVELHCSSSCTVRRVAQIADGSGMPDLVGG